MIKQSELMRSAGKVTSYISGYVSLAGAESREEVLRLFDNMQMLFPQWVIATCPMFHPDLQYMSANGKDVFGYSNEYLLANSRMEKFFDHVHDADKKDLLECFTYVEELLTGLPAHEHSLYRKIFHYRFHKPNGEPIYLHDEKAVIRLPGGEVLYYGLFRDITHEKAFTGVKLEIFKRDQLVSRIEEFKPSSVRNRISKREAQLLGLIRQGLSTKEIAYYLKISPNTARNIKSKLFEKYRVSNSIELLNATV